MISGLPGGDSLEAADCFRRLERRTAHLTRRLIAAAACIVCASVVLAASCGEETVGPNGNGEPTVGDIQVSLNVSGTDVDPDGCAVSLDGGEANSLSDGGSVTFSDLSPGSYSLRLSDLAMNCTVANNPRSVTVTAGQTTTTSFDVSCVAQKAGQGILGRGYDVFGKYADAAYSKSQVLDQEALNDAGLLEDVPDEHSSFETISGRTASEYQHHFANRTSVSGSYGFFSGSVNVAFEQNRLTRQEYEFATVQSLIRKYRMQVAQHVTTEQLKDYLTSAAGAAINDASVPPADVFNGFGTHVLRGIVVGGRADYSVSANMLFEQEDRTIGVYAEVSMEAKLSLDVTNETVDQTSLEQFNSTKEEHLEVYGGSSQLGQAIIDNGSYNAWLASIDDNPSFCDFTLDGLVPIWQLADDAGRQQELEQYFVETLAPEYDIELANLISNFDVDAEGWTKTSDGIFEYVPTGGQECIAGGCVRLVDPADGYGINDETREPSYFVAPDWYGGSWTRFYGGSLRFMLRNRLEWEQWVYWDSSNRELELYGVAGTLGYRWRAEHRPTADTWEEYDIKLVAGGQESGQESGIWMYRQLDGSWDYATEEQVRSVLDKVLGFRIKGEADFEGSLRDETRLDRVAVCKPDEPCNN